MDANDSRRIALGLHGAEENSHMGKSNFRLNFCDARLGRPGLRKPDAHAGAAGGVRGGTARSFRPHRGWLGTYGNDPYPAGCGERGGVGRCLTRGMEAAAREERKVKTQEPCASRADSGNEDVARNDEGLLSFPAPRREDLFERERGRRKANQAVSSNQ
jgi:hypothetical protein